MSLVNQKAVLPALNKSLTVFPKIIINARWSDAGNAKRLVSLFGDSIRYCAAFKSWFIWNGKYWEPDVQNQIELIGKETISHVFDAAYQMKKKSISVEGQDRAEKFIKFCLRSESAANIANMISLSSSEPQVAIKPSDLNADNWLLNVNNGVIDLKTGDLLPHDRKYLITKIAPVDFDRTADCPRFKKFLLEVLGCEEVVRYVEKALGYGLTGVVREHHIYIFWGPGRNGKGVILERVMPRILGGYLHTATIDLLMQKRNDSHSTAFADLHGARFVVCGETKSGARFNEAMVKAMTGGDRVTARKLYKDNFTFEPTYKIFMHTNHKPQVYGREVAMWDRLKVIHFPKSLKEHEIDHNLEPMLFLEAPGILNLLIKGCLAWQKEGLQTPDKIRQAVEEYKVETDQFGDFLRQEFGKSIDMEFSGFYERYKTWVQANGEKRYGKNFVSRLLKERGYEIYNGTGNRTMVRGGVNQVATINQKTGTSI